MSNFVFQTRQEKLANGRIVEIVRVLGQPVLAHECEQLIQELYRRLLPGNTDFMWDLSRLQHAYTTAELLWRWCHHDFKSDSQRLVVIPSRGLYILFAFYELFGREERVLLCENEQEAIEILSRH